jgi:hypothetical protein
MVSDSLRVVLEIGQSSRVCLQILGFWPGERLYFTPSNSTSNTSVELGGITPGYPREP